MNMTVWELLEIAESINAPDKDEEIFTGNRTFDAKNGWKVVVFYDCPEIDYIDSFVDPFGQVYNVWDTCFGLFGLSAEDISLLQSWNKCGDIARLRNLVDESPRKEWGKK